MRCSRIIFRTNRIRVGKGHVQEMATTTRGMGHARYCANECIGQEWDNCTMVQMASQNPIYHRRALVGLSTRQFRFPRRLARVDDAKNRRACLVYSACKPDVRRCYEKMWYKKRMLATNPQCSR